MSNINVSLPIGEELCNGKKVSFIAPCNCADINKIIIDSVEYDLVDSLGNVVAGTGTAFCSGAMVSVMIDTVNLRAYMYGPCGETIQTMTLAEYNALESRDPDTFYAIIDDNDSIPPATTDTLGVVKIDGSTIVINNGTISVAEITSLNNLELTGEPIAPTAPVGTNTTQVATTAFVLENGCVVEDSQTVTEAGSALDARQANPDIEGSLGYAISTGIGAKAEQLTTARTINGVAFDGTSDITITADPASTITVEQGGTGAITAADARTNLGVAYGTEEGTVCQGNDSRLSDARTPTEHSQAASTITAGTLGGQIIAPAGTDYTTARVRNGVFTTTDPGAGAASSYPNGTIVYVYE